MNLYDGFPKALRIGHYEYAVVLKDRVDDEDSLGTHLRGDTITLKKDQGNAVVALDTAFHEINHAIFDVFGLGDGEWNEEAAVVAITSGWVMVYRDNPQFVAWLWRMIPPRESG